MSETKEELKESTDVKTEDVFKVPTLVIPPPTFKLPCLPVAGSPKLPPISKTTCSKDTEAVSEKEVVHSNKLETAVEPECKPKTNDKESISVAYKEPKWSGVPQQPYSFEVIKNGVILEYVDLSCRPFTVCGRLTKCDVVMEHPSISRYHAIIQYRSAMSGNDAQPEGFYLYDLDSTHGTQLNKNPVKPRTYYRLHVGHIIKFGGSSRNYILQGPEEDIENESPLTVTEIKEQRIQEELKLKLEEEERIRKEKEIENEGVSWGMGDDAEDEDPSDINPFSIEKNITNDDSYFDDPKKTLRGWFEREGCNLEYKVEEVGQAEFLCKIHLPIDNATGQPLIAEAKVKGKKKEAVIACALEACRMLDRQGVLRQSTVKSKKVLKKNWEDDDYYDSDEDTFLDRTGTIERKRQQRIKNAGKVKEVVETYDSLLEKHNKVLEEICKTETTLHGGAKKDIKQKDDAEDSLESYMKLINNDQTLDRSIKTDLKLKLAQLKLEEKKLAKLLEIAKPAILPSFMKSGVTQKMQSFIFAPTVKGCSSIKPESKNSELEKNKNNETMEISKCDVTPEIVNKTSSEKIISPISEIPVKTISPISRSTDDHSITETELASDNKKDSETQPITPPTEIVEKKAEKRRDSKDKKMVSKRAKLKYEYDDQDPNYAMWLPPDDQSGDGKTRLNDRFGY